MVYKMPLTGYFLLFLYDATLYHEISTERICKVKEKLAYNFAANLSHIQ